MSSKVLPYVDHVVTCDHSSFIKLNPLAEPPSSVDGNGGVYSVNLIDRTDGRVDDQTYEVNEFHTGLALIPPPGFHFEVIADAELYKSGYFLPNTIVIDPSTAGQELIVPLYKFKDESQICLPFAGINVVVRENIETQFVMTKPQQQHQPQHHMMMQQQQQSLNMPQFYPPPTQQQNYVDRVRPRKGNTMM